MKTCLITLITLLSVNQIIAQTDSSKIYLQKGLDEKKAGRNMVAAKYFDKAIEFDQNNIDAYIENGKANLEMRRLDIAERYFTKANELQPTNPVAIKELAGILFSNHQFQKAIDMAQRCKDCPEVNRIIAMSNFNLEDYGKAIEDLQKEVYKNPNDAEALYSLGRSYLEQDDYKNSIAQYQKAVNVDTTKSTWMYELALQYYNIGDFSNAKKYFLKAGDKGYPKSNDYYENLGFTYLSMGDVDNGMKIISAVLVRKPNDKDILSDVALAMYKTKHYDDALGYYQKILELNPKEASALYMAGVTFQKMGQKEKGMQMCDEAIKLDPALAKNRQKKGGDSSFGL